MKALGIITLAACGGASPPGTFAEQPLATEPGLSGLAIDQRGDAWTIAERAASCPGCCGH